MAKYKYVGTDERVFPTLSLVLQPNQEFEASDDFNSSDVTSVRGNITATAKPSATPEKTQESE